MRICNRYWPSLTPRERTANNCDFGPNYYLIMLLMFLSPSRARFVSSVQKCRRINKEDVIQKVPRIAAAAARAASLARSVLSCVVVAAANVAKDRVSQWRDILW